MQIVKQLAHIACSLPPSVDSSRGRLVHGKATAQQFSRHKMGHWKIHYDDNYKFLFSSTTKPSSFQSKLWCNSHPDSNHISAPQLQIPTIKKADRYSDKAWKYELFPNNRRKNGIVGAIKALGCQMTIKLLPLGYIRCKMKRNHSVPFVCFSCAATAPIGPADWPAGGILSTDKTPTTARTFSAAGLPVRIIQSPVESQWKIGTQKSRSILLGKNPKTSNQVRR